MKSVKKIIFNLTLIIFIPVANAKIWQVSTQDSLQTILDSASPGDQVQLLPGKYLGNFVINHSIDLSGMEATLDAQGHGHGLLINAENVTIGSLSIVNWGDDLTEQNSGIYSDRKSNNITIKNCLLKGDGFGVWLQNGEHNTISNNVVIGNDTMRSSDRGNGIQISNIKNTKVTGNNISKSRDGLYVISSTNNTISNNTVHDLRYGIHYMYSYDNKIIYNHAYNTRAGYAMMNSRNLEIRGNTTENSDDYGFLINFIIYSNFEDNIVKNVWTPADKKVLGRDGKGLFIYNSGYNTIRNNHIENAEIGIHLTAGSEEVEVSGNNFIDNQIQVKYVSNKKQEWSQEINGVRQGNYWSNYRGWDMSGDGKGDIPFEPNDSIDKLFWKYPEAKFLMDSPAILLLRWVQQQFPVLKSPGVKDSSPLMKPNMAMAVK
ncbi:putative ABC transporter binding protein NosD [Sinobacterium norvegicum]|uniref:ABC transporter binding protein NosD n=1 Tax=Sinobacterium norvegicum TaxID=1641715 RepID=A0ABM9AEA0_9GAMM|nr:nitrous oxide reductase family maturation protein NosD [Sinobacterium norvegicum]CAH0991526.1 putative ABC transporter binding protein NosD [Sinobacterium norvegicum]